MQTTGLTLQEALKALYEQKCSAIKRAEWSRRTLTLMHGCWLSDPAEPYDYHFELHITCLLATDWMLINPNIPTKRKEMKPVWTLVNIETDESCGDIFPTEEAAEDNKRPGFAVSMLIGHYDRPIPQKVTRRVEFPMHFDGNISCCMDIPFSERPAELANTSGIATYVYETEEP